MANTEEHLINKLKNQFEEKVYLLVSGQKDDNCLYYGSEKKNYKKFQFGDLRIQKIKSTNNKMAIVEFESGGGHSNLLKYYFLEQNKVEIKRFLRNKKSEVEAVGFSFKTYQIKIFHCYMFEKGKPNDYVTHTDIWEHLLDSLLTKGIKTDILRVCKRYDRSKDEWASELSKEIKLFLR